MITIYKDRAIVLLLVCCLVSFLIGLAIRSGSVVSIKKTAMSHEELISYAYMSLMSHPRIKYDPKDLYQRALIATNDYEKLLDEIKEKK